MLIIFNVSSANSAGADASASSGFVKKPKVVVNALKSKAFLRVDTASFSTSFDEEEEQISRSLIAEEDTFFLIIPFLLAFVAKAFVCCEKPPDDFDDAPRREEAREDDRDDGIVVFDAEKEAEMFISCVSCAQRREKKWINWKKFN